MAGYASEGSNTIEPFNCIKNNYIQISGKEVKKTLFNLPGARLSISPASDRYNCYIHLLISPFGPLRLDAFIVLATLDPNFVLEKKRFDLLTCQHFKSQFLHVTPQQFWPLNHYTYTHSCFKKKGRDIESVSVSVRYFIKELQTKFIIKSDVRYLQKGKVPLYFILDSALFCMQIRDLSVLIRLCFALILYVELRTNAFHTYLFPSQILYNQAQFKSFHRFNHQDIPTLFLFFIPSPPPFHPFFLLPSSHQPTSCVSPSSVHQLFLTLLRYHVFINTINRTCWPIPIDNFDQIIKTHTHSHTMSFATSSSSSMRRHPASLLPKMVHNPSLLDLVKCPVSRDMIGE